MKGFANKQKARYVPEPMPEDVESHVPTPHETKGHCCKDREAKRLDALLTKMEHVTPITMPRRVTDAEIAQLRVMLLQGWSQSRIYMETGRWVTSDFKRRHGL